MISAASGAVGSVAGQHGIQEGAVAEVSGSLLLDAAAKAVTFADVPVMAAYLCLIALIFVVINLVVDLLYFAVDPRLRIERAGAH